MYNFHRITPANCNDLMAQNPYWCLTYLENGMYLLATFYWLVCFDLQAKVTEIEKTAEKSKSAL